MTNLIGKTLGRYRVMERIGRGGTAEVYKGYQSALDRYVAIKVLHAFLLEEADSRDRFRREAQAVATLRHPNIVQIFDFDAEHDVYFMVMEYVGGPTLKSVLQDQSASGTRLSLIQIEQIITGIGSALAYAHRRDMIHRDVKPHNIMFTSSGQAVLADFGIAKIVGGSNVSVSGGLSGTPAYMSPEQGRGETLDTRSDIYSLGVVLYEMVTGRVPFDADTPFGILIKHMNEPLPRPRDLNPALPEQLELVVFKAMAKALTDRYQTIDELVRAVQEVAMAPALGTTPLFDRPSIDTTHSGTAPFPRSPVPVVSDSYSGSSSAPPTGHDGAYPEFEQWPALLQRIARGQCTPILGPGITESLIGSQREIARRWSDTYRFPLSPHDSENLPQVAQYLAVNQGAQFPRDELSEYLRSELWRRYGDRLPTTLHNATLEQLMEAAVVQRRVEDPIEPYNVLAHLPFPVYITTNSDSLLEQALVASDRQPEVELCRWNDEVEQLPSIYDTHPGYRPEILRPLVYHLFGNTRVPSSLVLTEDDYFDYLIGVTSNKDLIPSAVRRAMADTSLLFLGFQMDDWNFRVLFRSIMRQQGGGRRKKYLHIAAQINPEEGRILSPERARRYLVSYFQDADISIYWGSADQFIRDLAQRSQVTTL